MVDNVSPPGYDASLFPQLEALGAPYNIYYEIRPPLPRERARHLAAAGVRHVQAGIESLQDDFLSLMRKGTTALQNIALLKHAREFGISVAWHILTGFPGELDAWYLDMAATIPLIYHLQPPASVHGITLQRFSPYMHEPSHYGIDPVPYGNYEFVYPADEATISALAYYFRDRSWPRNFPEMNRDTPGTTCLAAAAAAWNDSYRAAVPPQLTLCESADGSLLIADSRACAPAHEVTVTGLRAHVCRQAADPIDRRGLVDHLATLGIEVSGQALDNAIAELVSSRLALDQAGFVLSLSVVDPVPSRDVPFPGGEVSEADFRRYLASVSVQRLARRARRVSPAVSRWSVSPGRSRD